ncbi:hypothetical protein YC2023_046101 [Brassica napus]
MSREYAVCGEIVNIAQILTLCSHTALLDENATSHKFRERWNPLSYSSYPLYSVSIALHGGSLFIDKLMIVSMNN